MSMIYKTVISIGDRIVPQTLQPLWQDPAGPKTIFFWAPLVKWGLVIAGISDLQRPAEKISVFQSFALATGSVVGTRFCFVIIPRSWTLISVNIFVGLTGIYQLTRAVRYQQSMKKQTEAR